MCKLIRNNWAFVWTVFAFMVAVILLVGALTANHGRMLPISDLICFLLISVVGAGFVGCFAELINDDRKESD